jgi:hypothetical protein
MHATNGHLSAHTPNDRKNSKETDNNENGKVESEFIYRDFFLRALKVGEILFVYFTIPP